MDRGIEEKPGVSSEPSCLDRALFLERTPKDIIVSRENWLGRGGLVMVYRATLDNGEEVALKVPHAELLRGTREKPRVQKFSAVERLKTVTTEEATVTKISEKYRELFPMDQEVPIPLVKVFDTKGEIAGPVNLVTPADREAISLRGYNENETIPLLISELVDPNKYLLIEGAFATSPERFRRSETNMEIKTIFEETLLKSLRLVQAAEAAGLVIRDKKPNDIRVFVDRGEGPFDEFKVFFAEDINISVRILDWNVAHTKEDHLRDFRQEANLHTELSFMLGLFTMAIKDMLTRLDERQRLYLGKSFFGDSIEVGQRRETTIREIFPRYLETIDELKSRLEEGGQKFTADGCIRFIRKRYTDKSLGLG